MVQPASTLLLAYLCRRRRRRHPYFCVQNGTFSLSHPSLCLRVVRLARAMRLRSNAALRGVFLQLGECLQLWDSAAGRGRGRGAARERVGVRGEGGELGRAGG